MNYYHINKDNLTIISGPHSTGSSYLKKLTNCGNPELLDLSTYDCVPEILPILTDKTKYGERTVYADRVEVAAVDKSPVELEIILTNRINRMEENCREYIEFKGDLTGKSGRVHFTAAPMIFDKAKEGKPKSLAIKTWVETAWGLYYQRLAMLQAGTEWDETFADFSSIGPIPYTLQESMTE